MYPGNPSLSEEVQSKALDTFKQALELVSEGRDQEALAGCEFILGLDGLFRPARLLQERIKSPVRPVVVDDLKAKIDGPAAARPAAAPAAPTPEAPATLDLDDIAVEDLGPADAAPAAPALSGLGAVLQDLLAKGNHQQVLQIAQTQNDAIAADPQLQNLVATARAALERPAAVDDDDLLALQQQSLSISGADDDEFADLLGTGELEDDLLGELSAEPPELDAEPELDLGAAGAAPSTPVTPAAPAVDSGPLSLDDGELSALDEPLDLEADELPDLDSLEEAPAPLQLEADTPAPAPDLPAGSPFEHGQERELDLESGDLDADSHQRISQLLSEGQEVFDRGDYQGAIDVWSRIFLIDVTHGQASQRIEKARQKKAELERQAEEAFHEASALIEKGQLEEAKAALARVIELDASNSLAREYLTQLESGKVPQIAARAEVAADPADFSGNLPLDAAAGTDEKSMEAAVARDRVVVTKKTDKKLVALAAAVALAVIGGGGYLVLNWDKIFPNTEVPTPQVPPRIDPIARATALHEQGETAQALEALRGLSDPNDPAYEQAQALIAKWEAATGGLEQDTGPSPEVLARRNQILTAARQAHGSRQFIRARKYFERAEKILALEGEDLALKKNCDAELEPLSDPIRQFDAGEYSVILPELWRRLDRSPGHPDVTLLIVDSYYNLALTDLQRGQPEEAAVKLQEALDADPENRDLQRLSLFAETYSRRTQDLLYRIFVKYLPARG